MIVRVDETGKQSVAAQIDHQIAGAGAAAHRGNP